MAKVCSWYNTIMNKIITTHVTIRGHVISVDQLKDKSQIIIEVECSHGRRSIRWSRRHQQCKQCAAEAGVFNTSLKGRKITWGNKISNAKKGIKATEEHKKALSIAQYGVKETEWSGFYEKSEIAKLRDSIEYLNFRKEIMFRDTYQCIITGMKGHLEVHHIDSVNTNKDRIMDSMNAVTLHKSVHSKFHLIYGNGDNTKAQFEEFKKNWLQTKPRMIFLCGQSGVGKTTLTSNLSDKFNIISYDKNKSKLDEVILTALNDHKIILLDVPMLISTLYKIYQHMAKIDMVFLIENNEVVKNRLLKRSGKIHNSDIRSKRIKSLAKKYASFTGNYKEVLAHLRLI